MKNSQAPCCFVPGHQFQIARSEASLQSEWQRTSGEGEQAVLHCVSGGESRASNAPPHTDEAQATTAQGETGQPALSRQKEEIQTSPEETSSRV